MSTLAYSTTLTVISCGDCAIPFAIPANLHRRYRQDGDSFWCPNGHRISYSQTEYEKVSEELAATKTSLLREQNEHATTEARRRAEKAAKTKIKNRIGKGVCPCCNRHFANVERHMASQHPGYDSGGVE